MVNISFKRTESYKPKITEPKKVRRVRKKIYITLHPEEIQILTEIAEKRKMSKSMTMGMLIREYKPKKKQYKK
jgi:hypothetical protein